MSLCSSTLQLTPSVCLHLLCLLLLLADSTSTVPRKDPDPTKLKIQLNTATLTAGDNGAVSAANAALEDSSEKNFISLTPTLNDAAASSGLPSQSTRGKHLSTASPSSQEPVSPDHPSPSPVIVSQLATLPRAHTDSITGTGVIISTMAEPVRNAHTPLALVTSTITATTMLTSTTTTTISTSTTTTISSTSTATTASSTSTTTTMSSTATATTSSTSTATTSSTSTTTTEAAPQSATAVKAPTTLTRGTTITTTLTNTTTIGMNMLPPSSLSSSSSAATQQPKAPSTGMPPIQTTSLATRPATTTVGSTINLVNHNELIPTGTMVAMVEVAGVALTRQLVDTASLLAILLFGLLFFLVTVAVFVTQAYESYRRKDYTQVDYLINGMYTDSGV